MSSRLTKEKRRDIMDSAVRSKFQKALDAVNQEERDLCNTFLPEVYSEETRRWLDEAPEGGVPKSSCVCVYTKRDICLGTFSVDSFSILYTELYGTPKYVASVSEGKKLLVLEKRKNSLIAQRSDFRRLIRGALESCTTTKQLQERYPDLAKHLPDVANSSGQLVVRSEDVEAAFKEPVPKPEETE